MESFVIAELTKISTGAEYDGHIWDRWLVFRCRNGVELLVFDHRMVDLPLYAGVEYNIIIFPTVVTGMTLAGEDEVIADVRGTWQDESWTAEVIDPRFRATGEGFTRTADNLTAHSWVLAQLSIGRILLHPEDFDWLPRAGERIVWRHSTVGLLGVSQMT